MEQSAIFAVIPEGHRDGLMLFKTLSEPLEFFLIFVCTLKKSTVLSDDLVLPKARETFEGFVGIDNRTIFLIGISERYAIDTMIKNSRQNLGDDARIFSKEQSHVAVLREYGDIIGLLSG